MKTITILLSGLVLMCATCATDAQITNVKDLVKAVNNGSPGDTVTIGAGVFRLAAPLVPKKNMIIKGAGVEKTIIMAAESWQPDLSGLPKKENPDSYLFHFDKTTGVKISRMTLTGPKLSGAIYCDNSDGLELSHLQFKSFKWSGIRTWRMDNFRVHDNEFIDAGGKIRFNGGALRMEFTRDSEFWNNRITKTKDHPNNYFGFVGRQCRNCRFHHNTVEVNFSLECAFYHDHNVEIDHNMFTGVISVPRFGGGNYPKDGFSYHIHHNWLKRSYAIEWARNGAKVDHNLFDVSTDDDKGNLITNFGAAECVGPTHFHNNLVKNPGRGLFWTKGIYNDYHFYHNHVKANTLTRKDGLFGFHKKSNFKTIEIRDNIIECSKENPRPLMRNQESYGATITNNKLTNVSDTASYKNPKTENTVGLERPLRFRCGVNGEYLVDGWKGTHVGETKQRDPKGLEMSCASLAYSDMSWDKALSEMKKQGFRSADLAMFEGWTHISPSQLTNPEAHGQRIAEVCRELQINPIAIHANFAVGKRGKFPGLTTPDPEARKTILEHFDRVVTCARVAEIPLINVQPGRFIDGMKREECLKLSGDMLNEMQKRAARAGITLSFENHTGSVGERPEDCLTLLKAAPGLKLDYDFSHTVACGYSVEETKPLLQYIAHIGIRNAKKGNYNLSVSSDTLDYPLDDFLAALRKAHVNAYVSIEYFEPKMREHIPALKKILENHGVHSR